MRSSLARFAVVLGAFALPALASAKIPFFGAIIPDTINQCPAGFAALIIVLNNLVSFFITFCIVFVTPLMLGYAGFLLVVNPFNPSAKAKARTLISNTVIGIVIALGGYLIVDSVLAVLYNPATIGANWYALVAGDGSQLCIKQAGSLGNLNQTPQGSGGLQVTGTGPGGSVTAVGSDGTQFNFQTSAIAAQLPAASSALKSLIGCIQSQVPKGVGQISDLTDTYSVADNAKVTHCASVGSDGDSSCGHAAHSCHYGGRSCVGSSYAVDYGDEQNADVIKAAAAKCGSVSWNYEGNHLHLSIGAQNNCNCDVGMTRVGN